METDEATESWIHYGTTKSPVLNKFMFGIYIYICVFVSLMPRLNQIKGSEPGGPTQTLYVIDVVKLYQPHAWCGSVDGAVHLVPSCM